MGPRSSLVALTTVVLLILVPFALVGHDTEKWATGMLEEAGHHRGTAAVLIVALLAADIFMPVPSSVLSTTAGAILGFKAAVVVSSSGMLLSAAIGYCVGRLALGGSARSATAHDGWLEELFQANGDWTIAMTRGVPVLAETAAVFAGAAQMPFLRFLAIAGVANLCVSAAYAFVGAFSVSTNVFLLAFLAAVGLPLGPILVLRQRRATLAKRQARS